MTAANLTVVTVRFINETLGDVMNIFAMTAIAWVAAVAGAILAGALSDLVSKHARATTA
jgi:ABC-type methionine transport system permease subunit